MPGRLEDLLHERGAERQQPELAFAVARSRARGRPVRRAGPRSGARPSRSRRCPRRRPGGPRRRRGRRTSRRRARRPRCLLDVEVVGRAEMPRSPGVAEAGVGEPGVRPRAGCATRNWRSAGPVGPLSLEIEREATRTGPLGRRQLAQRDLRQLVVHPPCDRSGAQGHPAVHRQSGDGLVRSGRDDCAAARRDAPTHPSPSLARRGRLLLVVVVAWTAVATYQLVQARRHAQVGLDRLQAAQQSLDPAELIRGEGLADMRAARADFDAAASAAGSFFLTPFQVAAGRRPSGPFGACASPRGHRGWSRSVSTRWRHRPRSSTRPPGLGRRPSCARRAARARSAPRRRRGSATWASVPARR